MNALRGVPSFWPCRDNLKRVDKILRNASATVEIQAAIAMIRKHVTATQTSVQNMISARKDAGYTNAQNKTRNIAQYPPGSILDTNADTQFPAQGLDVSKPVLLTQAVLRAVASRFVMPEFMLTADASNANYASTMVAEGPAVKNFGRAQQAMILRDREVFDRVIRLAIQSGRLNEDFLRHCEIKVTPPKLAVRDPLQEVQRDNLLVLGGAMSVQTLCARNQLDYEHEMEMILQHQERMGELVKGNVPPMEDGDGDGDDGGIDG
jgi:capsid protein